MQNTISFDKYKSCHFHLIHGSYISKSLVLRLFQWKTLCQHSFRIFLCLVVLHKKKKKKKKGLNENYLLSSII